MAYAVRTSFFAASLFFVSTTIVVAQDMTWFASLAAQLENLLLLAIPLLVALALLVFIWGLVVFIVRSGDENAVAEGKRKMVWGVVALFVIISVWGLVALLQQLTGVRGKNVTRPSFSISGLVNQGELPSGGNSGGTTGNSGSAPSNGSGGGTPSQPFPSSGGNSGGTTGNSGSTPPNDGGGSPPPPPPPPDFNTA